MKNILIIKANPKSLHNSYGLQIGQAFIEAYIELNPNDKITQINIFDMYIPEINQDMLEAWSKLSSGNTFFDLSNNQQALISSSNEILEQFLEYDKFIFITPLWNLSYPARLKSYIDALCVEGKTFQYNENGVEGLIKNKKVLHIHSSGGIHQGGHADRHLRDILGFIGLIDIQTLIIEGHDAKPNNALNILNNAKKEAKNIALDF